MSRLNIAEFDREYYVGTNCLEDGPQYFDLARVISEAFQGKVLVAGCGLGWLAKHFCNRGIDAWGIDSSAYAINNSVIPERCMLGDLRKLTEVFPTTFDVVVMKDVAQALELNDLVEALTCIKKHCKGHLFFIDQISEPRTHFALDRSQDWYSILLKDLGWVQSKLQSFIQRTSLQDNLLVFEQFRMPFREEEPDKFVDPWLVHHDNTNIMTCTLPTSETESAAFIEHHKDLWMTPHFVSEGGSRAEREKIGVTRGSGDYVFVSDDTACLSRAWLLMALSAFRNADIGAVVSPVRWALGLEESPEGDYWNRFPMMFRTLAYQQCQGDKSKFDELGWKVAKIKTPLSARECEEVRVFDTKPSVTIITPFDDGKLLLLDRYFEVLKNIDYPHDRLHIHFWDDSREEKRVSELLKQFVWYYGDKFASIATHKAKTEDYWLYMDDDNYYRWEGVKYPISCRVAGLYNRATSGITTDQVLLWESDTIPTDANFLQLLSENLTEFDGGISAHYVCRIEKRSLAWKVEQVVPLIWNWLEPGTGVDVVDVVPHGCLLLNGHILKRFRFNVLANDPRDCRGADLIMGRDFLRLGLKLKIHWGIFCDHYNPDGETFVRPEV